MIDNDRLKPALDYCAKRCIERINGLVYFIEAGEFIKIGVSKRSALASRLNSVQVGCPFPAVLVGCVPSFRPFECEQMLHHVFGSHHFRGEWFRLTRSQLKKGVKSCGLEIIPE